MEKSELAARVKAAAYLEGDFVLRSGARSSFYLDCRQVTLDAEGAYLVATLMLDRLRGVRAQAVGGPAMAALMVFLGTNTGIDWMSKLIPANDFSGVMGMAWPGIFMGWAPKVFIMA